MSHFRLFPRTTGNHTIVKVFAGESWGAMHSKLGELVMLNEEWHHLSELLQDENVEIMKEKE